MTDRFIVYYIVIDTEQEGGHYNAGKIVGTWAESYNARSTCAFLNTEAHKGEHKVLDMLEAKLK